MLTSYYLHQLLQLHPCSISTRCNIQYSHAMFSMYACSEDKEWGEFLHLPGKLFYDFNEIRTEIERETERLTGKNKGISNKSINLKIYSPYVLNLTLVDLPGVTKVPTGDQPEDVEQQILAMCLEFISNPNAIILAVSAANQDLANSEGLKLARAVDPDGLRTIGVLTKVDIMDQGTDCCDILNNQVIALRRGYIAVVNRSQKDIQDNLPIRKGLAKEMKFFQTHMKYRNYLSKCGTTNMTRCLNQMLMHHIKECLPEIKSKINILLRDVLTNMTALGESLEEQGNSTKGILLLRILSQFATTFSSKVDGTYNSLHLADLSELYGGARISYIFTEVFAKRLRSIDPFDSLTDEDIRTTMANANGTRQALFVPEISFDLLVRKQISRLERPGLECLELVHKEVLKMVIQSETPELSRFPYLRDRTFEIVNQLLRKCMMPAQKMLTDLIQIELAYINTSHPDFVGGKAAVQIAAFQAKKVQGHSNTTAAGVVTAAGTKNNSTIVPSDSTSTSSSSSSSSDAFVSTPQPQHAINSSSTTTANNNTTIMPTPNILINNNNNNSNNNSYNAQHNLSENKGFFGLFQSPTANRGGIANTTAPNNNSNSNNSSNNNHHHNNTASEQHRSHHNNNSHKLSLVPEKMKCPSNPSDKEKIETEVIKSFIVSYFDIVKKNYVDMVPKTIMRFLVLAFKESLQNELVSNLYKYAMMMMMML